MGTTTDCRSVSAGGARRSEGFTIIELLVVIGVIVILMSIAFAIAAHVAAGGRLRVTADTIRVLEVSLDEYSLETDSLIPAWYEDWRANRDQSIPIVDARQRGAAPDDAANDTITPYSYLVAGVSGATGALSGLDPRFVTVTPTGEEGASVRTILDGWGEPIRFVHPEFDGGHGDFWDAERERMQNRDDLIVTGRGSGRIVQYSRSWKPFDPDDASGRDGWVGDADEGICPTGRPYFYSAGPDGDPGTRRNNVYGGVVPTWPAETRGFQY